MPEYELYVRESYRGTIIVEAESLEEAKEKYNQGLVSGDVAVTGERCDWEVTGGRENKC